jgi:serine/threonine protein kinase
VTDGPHTRKVSAREPGRSSASAQPAAARAAWDGSAPVVAQQGALLAGTYEPLIELASGGMARVVVGQRVGAAGFQRLVVIKQVHRHLLGRPDFANFFRDEARIASLIHHANVVPVIDVVEAPGELLLVMEYVESVSLSLLRTTVAKAPAEIPTAIVFRIFLDMLAGLQAAHDLVDGEGRPLDVVHRDVSPQNLIVGLDGVSRLIDFGVAKASHRLTESESGDIKGKYAYMSPEQVLGLDVDRRSDVFAAAVVLFETLTNVRLFAGEHAMETIRRVVDEPLPDLNKLPNVPAALHDIFKRALARDVQQRIATAAELAEAIEGCVPVASHRRVAECVAQHCGPLLAERRALLENSRKGNVNRSGSNRVINADEETLGAQASHAATEIQATTQVLTPNPRARSASSATSVAAYAETPPSSRRTKAIVISVIVGALLATVVFVAVSIFAKGREPVAGASATPSASSSGVMAASAAPSASTTATANERPAVSAETSARKPPPVRRPPPTPAPRADDLQGDPYGTK